VHVDPIKPTLKPPGTKRLKLKYEKLVSNFDFNYSLRRYDKGKPTLVGACVGAIAGRGLHSSTFRLNLRAL